MEWMKYKKKKEYRIKHTYTFTGCYNRPRLKITFPKKDESATGTSALITSS